MDRPGDHPELWYSAEKLQPYYNFICLVRKVLEEVITEENATNSQDMKSGFAGWPTPNGNYWRTTGDIYMNVEMIKLGKGILPALDRLITPFGYVHLMGNGGGGLDQWKVALKFLKRLQSYGIEQRVIPALRIVESPRGLCMKSNHQVQIIQLCHASLPPSPITNGDHHIYECPFVKYDTFEEIFEKVSGGRKHFTIGVSP
jgi:hypothetical protein